MSGIGCNLCPHNCPGSKGFCGDRRANLGLFSAVNMDPVEKKPLYHIYPGSQTLSLGGVGCNLKCPWCQNWQISKEFKNCSTYKISTSELIQMAKERGVNSVTFTYNEPSIHYEYVTEASRLLKAEGIDTLLVSNGYISEEYLEGLYSNIKAVNIDLKSFNKDIYKKTIGGDLETVLNTLKYVNSSNTWLEITTLLVPGINDSTDEIKNMVNWILKELGDSVPLHLSAFYPNYNYKGRTPTKEDYVLEMVRLAREAGLLYVYPGNIMAGDSSTYCPSCNFRVIKREGYKTESYLEGNRCPNCKNIIPGIFK
ncbi:MAG: AmmeMemoRadiSam system radical SAM enzyme [Spirochaetaceae bacterium]